MNKKDLEFILAYAEVHDLMQMPFAEAFNKVCTYVDECCEYYDISPEVVEKDFLEVYRSMKEWGFETEVKESMKQGMSFFAAASDWDLC